MNEQTAEPARVQPRDAYLSIFLRFLRFGFLAWGGPVAQIAMIRQELVEEEEWVDRHKFNRVVGVYQALPGPEAHELCVYFGYIRGGRIGGFLAGLGFMLPGFIFMFALSWLYVTYGIQSAVAAGVFAGFAPAVAALVVRAVHRIGGHSLLDPWLWGIAATSAIAHAAGIHFAIPLLAGGAAYFLASRRHRAAAIVLLASVLLLAGWGFGPGESSVAPASGGGGKTPTLTQVAAAGLRGGLLTFGGAYTVIPFLQHDAVVRGEWITNAEFLDGLAISSALPAPLIIFSTFVGYVGGGPLAALVITVAIFAPAFAFTLIGHGAVERAVNDPRLHTLLDGVTAAVVGLITVAGLTLLPAAVTDALSAVLFLGALLVLARWKSRLAIVAVMLACGSVGAIANLL